MRKSRILAVCFLIGLVVVSAYPLETRADFTPTPLEVLLTDKCLPYLCFWGVITKKQLKLCLIKIPSFPFVIPNPAAPAFHYYEIAQPWPPNFHRLYYVYSVVPEFKGETKLRDRREKTVEVAGAYIPGLSEVYRQTCTFNKDSLPKNTTGTIRIWGTGCKPGELVPFDLSKCLKTKK